MAEENIAYLDQMMNEIPYDAPEVAMMAEERRRKYSMRPPGRPPAAAGGGAGSGDGEGPFDWPPNLRPGPGETGWQRAVRFAEARMRARMRQAASGIDPRAFWDAFIIGADRFAKGMRNLGQWLSSVGEYKGFGDLWRKVWGGLQGVLRPEAVVAEKRPRVPDADTIIGNIEEAPRIVRPVKRPTPAAIEAVMKAMFDPRPYAGFDPKSGKPPGLKMNINQVEDVNHVRDMMVRMVRAARPSSARPRGIGPGRRPRTSP